MRLAGGSKRLEKKVKSKPFAIGMKTARLERADVGGDLSGRMKHYQRMEQGTKPGRLFYVDRRGQTMRKGVVTTILVAVAAALLVAGCSGDPLSTREKGTLIGGGLGAATGAIIGAAVGAPGAGAAIGGAIGGIGGFAVGNSMQNNENAQAQTQGQIQQQQQQLEQQRQQIQQLKQQQETE
jgi:outer membrane protein with glycine zipper